MSSSWIIIEPKTTSEDIIYDEIIVDIKSKEENTMVDNVKLVERTELAVNPSQAQRTVSTDTFITDEMLAKMLQIQFDEETKHYKENPNGTSEVPIEENGEKLDYDFESDLEEEIDAQVRENWDRFDALEREYSSVSHHGNKAQKSGKTIMNKWKNIPEYQSGDIKIFSSELHKIVSNSLNVFSKHELDVGQNFQTTEENVVASNDFCIDHFTILTLYKMINNQLIKKINSVINNGLILHASTNPSYPKSVEKLPKECVVKIFVISHSEMKEYNKAIRDDRFLKNKMGKQTRKSLQLLAEKQMSNLSRMRAAGIRCPEVILRKNHVLVLSFIGKDGKAAPNLSDANMTLLDYTKAYHEIVEIMKTLYKKANLVHPNLSVYNILWHDKHCYIMNVRQLIESSHQDALRFLYGDCNNVVNFFSRKGVRQMSTAYDLFISITGYFNEIGNSVIKESFTLKSPFDDKCHMGQTYNFDNPS